MQDINKKQHLEFIGLILIFLASTEILVGRKVTPTSLLYSVLVYFTPFVLMLEMRRKGSRFILIDLKWAILLLFFLLSISLSTLFSEDQRKSFFIFPKTSTFVFFVFFPVFAISYKLGPKSMLKVFLTFFRLMSYGILFTFFSNILVYTKIVSLSNIGKFISIIFPTTYIENPIRTALWFAEPSYLASYYGMYMALTIFLWIKNKDKNMLREFLYASFTTFLITSTTGFVVFLAVLFFSTLYMIIKRDLRFVNVIMVSFLFASVLAFISFFVFPAVFNLVFARIFLSGAAASGGRDQVTITALKDFIKSPFFGVGYGLHGRMDGIVLVPGYVSPASFASILGELGIFSFISYYSIVFKAMFPISKPKNPLKVEDRNILNAFKFCLLITVVASLQNSSFKENCTWSILALCAGLEKYYREIKYEDSHRLPNNTE